MFEFSVEAAQFSGFRQRHDCFSKDFSVFFSRRRFDQSIDGVPFSAAARHKVSLTCQLRTSEQLCPVTLSASPAFFKSRNCPQTADEGKNEQNHQFCCTE